MRCPYCNTINRADRDACYHCGKDISMLRLLMNKSRYHYNHALEHAERGRYSEAVAELNNALDLDASFSQARVVLGTMYARLQDMEKAKETWRGVFAQDDSLHKAHNYLEKAETVMADQPARKWLRIFVSVSGILLLLCGFLLVLNFLPATGLNRLTEAYQQLADGDLARADELFSQLNARRHELDENIVRGLDSLRLMIDMRIRQTIDDIKRDIASNEFAQAIYHLEQARQMNWPEDALNQIDTLNDQIILALENQIAREADEALDQDSILAIGKAQGRINELADLANAPRIRRLADNSIERLERLIDQKRQLEELSTRVADYLAALRTGEYSRAAQLAERALVSVGPNEDSREDLKLMMADAAGLYAADMDAGSRMQLASALGVDSLGAGASSVEAAVSPVQPSTGVALLEDWFRANTDLLLDGDVPEGRRKEAVLNHREIESAQPGSPAALYSAALAAAARGERAEAAQLAQRLTATYPEYPRPAKFDTEFDL